MSALTEEILVTMRVAARKLAPSMLHALLRQATSTNTLGDALTVIAYQLAVARVLEHVHLASLRTLAKSGEGTQVEALAAELAAEMIAAGVKAGAR